MQKPDIKLFKSESEQRHIDIAPKLLKGIGTEIGAYLTPIPGISPIYVDKFEVYIGSPCKADYYGDVVDLPFLDNSLDYIANSHVFEHTANPVKALVEWYRVLKPGGIVYLVIPDKNHTFDLPRKTTPIQHMIDDYFAKTTDLDSSHIDDFCFGANWKVLCPDTPESEETNDRKKHASFYWNEVRSNREINLHFHVFEPESTRGLIEEVSAHPLIPAAFVIELIEGRFPADIKNGILLILRKPGKDSLYKKLIRWSKKFSSKNYPLKPNARKLNESTTG